MPSYKKDWVSTYKEKGALWIHDGNPKRPHALLTSGNHSNGFFNSGLVCEDPLLLAEACHDLAFILRSQADIRLINRVVGPAMGAIAIAHCIAWSINRLSNRAPENRCLSSYTEKIVVGDFERQILKRTTMRPSEVVLTVEDVITTGGSVERTATAVTEAKGELFPFILTLVNRSGLTEVNGHKIVALIDQPMPMWHPIEGCPLCKQGSQAIRPKGTENWTALNANYET